MDIEFVRSRFIKHFDGKTGNIYFSPGRINLIGEHTDYNGGFVFPGAVDKGIMAEVRPNGTDTVMAYSIDLKDRVEFKVTDPEGPRATWARFIYGMVREFQALGVDVKGFNIAFAGDVPLGAGMSSSAAMESCFGCALNDLFADNKISKWDIVLAGQLIPFSRNFILSSLYGFINLSEVKGQRYAVLTSAVLILGSSQLVVKLRHTVG